MRISFVTVPIVLVLFFVLVSGASAVGDVHIQFFYSATCPHCHAERSFLDTLEEKYPDIVIESYLIDKPASQRVLRPLLEAAGAIEYFGVVPVTFVGDELFIGFDTAAHIGADIEASLVRLLSARAATPTPSPEGEATPPAKPIVQSSAASRYNVEGLPLPIAALVLGFLDGFNVCSLGALALILGLVLVVRDRRRVAILGGAFILMTALVYGALIVLWYRLFSVLGAYIGMMQVLVGGAAAIAGVYFLYQFWRFRRFGPTCGFSGSSLVHTVTARVQHVLGGGSGVAAAIIAVLIFAAVITAVEFPCSAAVPLVFAGMLAESGVGMFSSLGLIGLFILMYLLDEILVFGIAVSRLRLWLASPSVATWAVLIEGIILFGIGVWYLLGVFS